jgi:hypothetical protein
MNAALITNAPALAYVKEWNAWIVVNNKTEMISWTDDPAEIDWLSTWVRKFAADKTVRRAVALKSSGLRAR